MFLTTDGSLSLLMQLANSAVRALAFAAGAGIGLAAFRVKSTSVRLFTWTAVLYTALAMPLFERMLPPLFIPTPVFLQPETARLAPSGGQVSQALADNAVSPATQDALVAQNKRLKRTERTRSTERITPASSSSLNRARIASSLAAAPGISSSFLRFSHWLSVRWATIAAGIYFAVALLLLGRFVVGLVFGRRLMRASRAIREPRVMVRLSDCARDCGLAFVPRAAESEFISVPVTMGALRSIALLPTGWREWDDAKLDAVVAHEVSHVARRDALTQHLSLLYRAFFWFSPLAWWIDRHLADLAEQASDEAALCCGADRNDYARTLLGFFEALHASPGRVWWQGVSMAKAGQAERRVERILAWRGAVTMGLKKSVAVAIMAFAIPVVYLTASVRPAKRPLDSQDMARAQNRQSSGAQDLPPEATPARHDAPSSTADTRLEPPPASASVAGGWNSGPPLVGPTAPTEPAPPIAPSAAWAGQSGSSYGHHYSYTYGDDDEQRFVIVSGKSDTLTMSGSSEDARHVEKLRKRIPGDFIWFQRDEKSYIIRDQATIDRARKLWAPQEELGKKQEALGKQQEALGKQQEALGAKMQQIQVKVPDMTVELDKLKAELKQLSSGATVEQVGRIQSEIGELQSRIGEIQSHAGDQQSKLGEEMGALGEKQGKLGAQQGELGRQQGALAEQASRQMKELLDDAIKKGTAQPEVGTDGGTL